MIVSLRELGPAGGARNELFDDDVILCAHTCEARHERCEERGAASRALQKLLLIGTELCNRSVPSIKRRNSGLY